MANARRSIGEAMALSADQRAFIQGGVKPAVEPMTSATPTDTPPISLNSPVETLAEAPVKKVALEPQAKSIRQRSSARSRLSIQLEEEEPMAPILAPLTTRLYPATADALRRACLEQRLRRRKPHTQQEIVELAVRGWLESNGFIGES